MFRIYPEIEMLESAARALGDLIGELVFVGGAIAGLLYTDHGSSLPRATVDVDITASFNGYGAYIAFTESLRKHGFSERMDDSVICRWWGHGLQLDVVPDSDDILKFTNVLYKSTILHAIKINLPSGAQIRIADAAHFLGTKLLALDERGESDLFASHDFEDIVNLIANRPEIVGEVASTDKLTRETIQLHLKKHVRNPRILDAIEGALSPPDGSLELANLILERMKAILSAPIA